MLCRCSPLIFNAFPSVLVTPILFFVHGFMSFEQRYTTVAFIDLKFVGYVIFLVFQYDIDSTSK